jgi:hypothetical protein
MLKISIHDTPSQRQLLVEGKLIAPWAAELRTVWRTATADLHGRQLIIDLRSLTEFSEDGEAVLLQMMKAGARFRCSGVFTKHVMKRLAAEIRGNPKDG